MYSFPRFAEHRCNLSHFDQESERKFSVSKCQKPSSQGMSAFIGACIAARTASSSQNYYTARTLAIMETCEPPCMVYDEVVFMQVMV